MSQFEPDRSAPQGEPQLEATCGASRPARIEWAVREMGTKSMRQRGAFATKKAHREALVWLAANPVP